MLLALPEQGSELAADVSVAGDEIVLH